MPPPGYWADAQRALMERAGRFPNGYTNSGRRVAAAVARENIALMKRERIVERVRDEIGPCFQERHPEPSRPSAGRRGPGGVGLMAAMARTRDKAGRSLVEPVGGLAAPARNLCVASGLVTRAVRDCLVFSPPPGDPAGGGDALVATLRSVLDLLA